MEYVIAAFRSRAHTVRFYEFLQSNGVGAQIINTPKEAGVGCGLSVRVSVATLPTLKKAVKIAGLNSFAGIFSVKTSGDMRTVRSI